MLTIMRSGGFVIIARFLSSAIPGERMPAVGRRDIFSLAG